ncbi:recombinase family protein [Arthrobacter bussei]|uniref:Recombinase family protein n=1 Tax=Arthrobacter bussei TaxID=2594179 RepID=A0A7X1NTE9_9MICC|nr:recombinase family protein [Arthrobacter bussei]MPY12313.1 recombinase family protein [Arthrobacter bussei]
MGHIIGYARVSTTDQHTGLQHDALTKAGASRVFTDHGVSGAKTTRPELDKMLDYLRPGDTLLVWRLDRLGRSMQHLVGLVAELKDRGVTFRSLHEGIDTSTINGELVFNIFASLAAFERELIRERTSAGLASARARGRLGGRPKKHNDATVQRIKELRAMGTMTPSEVAAAAKVSVSTMYRLLRSEPAQAAQ